MIQNISQSENVVCNEYFFDQHFETICKESLEKFIEYLQILPDYGLTNANFDLALGWDDNHPFHQRQDKPTYFFRYYLKNNQLSQNNCCFPIKTEFILNISTSFDNQKLYLQKIKDIFRFWLENFGQKIDFFYTENLVVSNNVQNKSYKYQVFFGNNHNQYIQDFYIVEPINAYNYHTFQIEFLLQINKI